MNEFKPAEIIAAAGDAMKIKAGQTVNFPHPLSKSISMSDIAHALAITKNPFLKGSDERSIVGHGMSSSDFGDLLADGVQAVTIAAYDGQGEHQKFCHVLEVPDFRPSNVPALDSDISLEATNELNELPQVSLLTTAGKKSVQLRTFGTAVVVSRQTIINDKLGAMTQVFAGLGASAARLEGALVTAALEGTDALDDGDVVFGEQYQNIVTDGLLNGFGNALALLRTQLTPAGQRANFKAKYLVTSPELELTGREMIFKAGLNIEVIVLADLPESRWYLLVDPNVCPSVAILRLESSNKPVRVERKKIPSQYDGIGIQVIADMGAFVLRRQGIIRGGTV